jgi:hypothetical protein
MSAHGCFYPHLSTVAARRTAGLAGDFVNTDGLYCAEAGESDWRPQPGLKR